MKKVAKVILYKDNKVLLQLRDNKPNIPFPNQWSLFGGKIEKDETARACTIREIKEELNATIKNIKFITKQTRYENNVEVEDNIFSAEINEEIADLILKEGKAMKLFSLKELTKITIVPHYKDYIIKFMEKELVQ
jgi:8-oxo-dGTP diphosphatase